MTGKKTNAELFEELAMPLFASLYNFAHWQTRNREEAEDLVQETYMKALRGFASFQEGSNFKAWMFRILRNTYLTSRTGLMHAKTVDLEGMDDDALLPREDQTPESILMLQLGQDAVERAIGDLPLAYREVLLLADVEELRYSEIAEALSVPMGTVMSRLSRARRLVRGSLQGKEHANAD